MSRRAGWRLAAVTVTVSVLVAACGGDGIEGNGDRGAGSPGGAGADDRERPDKEPGADVACGADIRERLPEHVDPDTCWIVPGPTAAVVVGDRVFWVGPEDDVPSGGAAPETVLRAYDATTGAEVWTSAPLPGELFRLTPVEVDGRPGVATLVGEHDEGDAVTAPSQAWGYLAWPADVDEDSPGEPAVHVSGPTEYGTSTLAGIRWTDQGLLAGDRLLPPEGDEFVPVELEPEPMLVGELYDLAENLVGVSGDGEVLLSYVSDVAYPAGGPDDGSTYVGWLARDPGGTTSWDAVTSFPNEGEVAIFAEGPARMPIVVGDHVVTIAATDETYRDFTVEWLDAATGAPGRPRAADLAGAVPTGGQADIIAGDVATLLSPDGRHLFAQWSTLALVVDVEAGTVARVDSDFDIHAAAIDDTTVYGSTENGELVVDLDTAEAQPLPEGTLAVTGVAGGVTLLTAESDEVSSADRLVVARND